MKWIRTSGCMANVIRISAIAVAVFGIVLFAATGGLTKADDVSEQMILVSPEGALTPYINAFSPGGLPYLPEQYEGYIVTVSSSETVFVPLYVFDRDLWGPHVSVWDRGNGWISGSGSTREVEWICLQLPEPAAVDMYRIYDQNQVRSVPNEWSITEFTFEGSNDGINWVVLDAVTDRKIDLVDAFGYSNIGVSEHYLENRAVYQYYRICIPKNGRSHTGYIGEWELWGYKYYEEPPTLKYYKYDDMVRD